MRIAAVLALILIAAPAAQAKEVRRLGPAQSPISTSAEIPDGSRLVWISGTVPDPVDPAAPAGSVQRYGDTAPRPGRCSARSRRSSSSTTWASATSS